MRKHAARDMTYTALACATISVCSWISVPLVPPFTLQTFAVFLCAGLLGWRRGTAAVAIYLVLGMIGAPVFSNFTGGFARLIGPTGGYLVGFLFTALLTGLIAELGKWKTLPLFLGMFAGLAALYTFGTVWFYFTTTPGTGWAGVWAALTKCVFPFIGVDLVKMLMAFYVVRRLEKLVVF